MRLPPGSSRSSGLERHIHLKHTGSGSFLSYEMGSSIIRRLRYGCHQDSLKLQSSRVRVPSGRANSTTRPACALTFVLQPRTNDSKFLRLSQASELRACLSECLPANHHAQGRDHGSPSGWGSRHLRSKPESTFQELPSPNIF
jgi:hypothetical protein